MARFRPMPDRATVCGRCEGSTGKYRHRIIKLERDFGVGKFEFRGTSFGANSNEKYLFEYRVGTLRPSHALRHGHRGAAGKSRTHCAGSIRRHDVGTQGRNGSPWPDVSRPSIRYLRTIVGFLYYGEEP